MSEQHDEAHTGPIKTPRQFLLMVVFSFILPVFIIIGLVYYVTSHHKPAMGASNAEEATAARIQKVGVIQVKDANRPLKSGEDVFKGQCAACHASGAAGAPKFGDSAAWGPRIKTGYPALLNSALKGKMPWPPKVVVSMMMWKLVALWFTWPTRLAPSSPILPLRLSDVTRSLLRAFHKPVSALQLAGVHFFFVPVAGIQGIGRQTHILCMHQAQALGAEQIHLP